MSAPDRIWMTNFVKDEYGARLGRGTISDLDHGKDPDCPEYIRADLATSEADELRAKVAKLQAAIKRQAGAAKTLRELTLAEVQHIKDAEQKEYVATRTLDSERDANAILTDEADELREECEILRTEKHADAEAIGALRTDNERLKTALVTMVYETTHLSPLESDGSHWCKISKDALYDARAALKATP